MPLRARFKKAFGRTSSGGSSGTTTPSGFPIEFYKPGEVPRSKYRGPWNQDHQDKLSAFTFSFGRKNSVHESEYSPAQTRTHSRRSSWSSHHRPTTKGSLKAKNLKAAERASSMIGHVEEIEGDDDVMNVGLSRQPTRNRTRRNADFDYSALDNDSDETISNDVEEIHLTQAPTISLQPLGQITSNDTPFTEEELSKALSEATLRPPRSAS